MSRISKKETTAGQKYQGNPSNKSEKKKISVIVDTIIVKDIWYINETGGGGGPGSCKI